MLPAGCEVIAIKLHGEGSWSIGYKVEVEYREKKLEYFLKVLLMLHRHINILNCC